MKPITGFPLESIHGGSSVNAIRAAFSAIVVLTLAACGGQTSNDADIGVAPSSVNDPSTGVQAKSRSIAMDSSEANDVRSASLKSSRKQKRTRTDQILLATLKEVGGKRRFKLPGSRNYTAIPQDYENNPLTAAKVALGKRLFHETALATDGNDPGRTGTWSCASCHHAGAGFKAGIPQGIGEGGERFGRDGKRRRLAADMDPFAPDGHPTKPDLQPLASPTAMNGAYQQVMLWNGQFGNVPGGINSTVPAVSLTTPDTPKAANLLGLPGLEIQAIAGLVVHRLGVDINSIVHTNRRYQALFDAAFAPGSYPDQHGIDGTRIAAGKAIAAYERTLLANKAPFQRWLRGKTAAMTKKQTKGAILFFGKAGCVACHDGPALSSMPDASADEMFFAVGFADFDLSDPRIHGSVNVNDRKGRGGFTGVPIDDYKFKVPQLYNLADTNVFGHGASFNSIREVVEYKNDGIAQNRDAMGNLDSRFAPLGLNKREVSHLVAFLSKALYDPALTRYEPRRLPSGQCFPVADAKSIQVSGCGAPTR